MDRLKVKQLARKAVCINTFLNMLKTIQIDKVRDIFFYYYFGT